MINKKVNIFPTGAILTVNPPIRTITRNVTKSTAEIRKCILARATVEEILPGGKTITLNLTNYDKDNTIQVDIIKPAEDIQELAAENVLEEGIDNSSKESDDANVQEPKNNTSPYPKNNGKNKKFTNINLHAPAQNKNNHVAANKEAEKKLTEKEAIKTEEVAVEEPVEVMDAENLTE